MQGQMSIFDFIPKTKFCFDDDINEIVNDLNALCERHGLEHEKPHFSIWQHVPNLGYRLSYTIIVYKDTDIYSELDELVEKAKTKNIELSVMWGAVWFFSEKDTGRLSISTLYKDKRRKIKKGG